MVFVLNAADTIEAALASVTSPDQPAVELIIMDGGSTDGTIDIIRKYESRIAFWRSRRDGSAAVAINEGVERASGEVIGLLPGDDWIEPGALRPVHAAFADDPQLGVLSCGARFVRTPGNRVETVREFLDPPTLDFTMANLVRWPLTPARFVRRSYYQEAGGYNSRYFISNDLDFLIKVLLKRPRTRVIPQLVYTFRMHEGSRTLGGGRSTMLEMLRGNIDLAEQHYAAAGLTRAERRELAGLHGRASSRLAWMLLSAGEMAEARLVLARAMKLNWTFPLKVPVWALQKAARRDSVL